MRLSEGQLKNKPAKGYLEHYLTAPGILYELPENFFPKYLVILKAPFFATHLLSASQIRSFCHVWNEGRDSIFCHCLEVDLWEVSQLVWFNLSSIELSLFETGISTPLAAPRWNKLPGFDLGRLLFRVLDRPNPNRCSSPLPPIVSVCCGRIRSCRSKIHCSSDGPRLDGSRERC